MTTESVRLNYDRVADAYAQKLFHELDGKPLDRELLVRFFHATGDGEICDLGCGPGHVAGFLRAAGANVFGLDLSPRMVERARELNLGIAFLEGDMLALPLPDGGLAGIVAFYAIVNIPPGDLPSAFREMARVLQPGGRLLLSFHIGDEAVRPPEMFGVPVSLDFYFFQPAAIARDLLAAGFDIEEIVERGPYAPEVEYQSRRAYIFARNAMSKVFIRPAVPNDARAIQDIAREAWSDVYAGIIPASVQQQAIDTWYSLQSLRVSIESPESDFVVAEHDRRAIGFAQLVYAPNQSADLTRIYVVPSEQRRGVGAKLFHAVTDRARARGVLRIQVTVAAQNIRARRFYEGLSFVLLREHSSELFGFSLPEVRYQVIWNA